MKATLLSHRDLEVYKGAAALRKEIFVLTLKFPKAEQFELTNQIRRSSRSVCASIGEAWRKRRYRANWISKLSDAEQEAAETQIWIETACECEYLSETQHARIWDAYERVISQLTLMAVHADKWVKPTRT